VEIPVVLTVRQGATLRPRDGQSQGSRATVRPCTVGSCTGSAAEPLSTHEKDARRPCRISRRNLTAQHCRLAARPCDGCIMVGEALRGLVTTMWRARFWRGRERSVIRGVPARTTVAYRQSRPPAVRERRLGTGAIPCPFTPAKVAICGSRVRRAGCLNPAFTARLRPPHPRPPHSSHARGRRFETRRAHSKGQTPA
jgi:hypothetical protein